jgi:hypothetical protein
MFICNCLHLDIAFVSGNVPACVQIFLASALHYKTGKGKDKGKAKAIPVTGCEG